MAIQIRNMEELINHEKKKGSRTAAAIKSGKININSSQLDSATKNDLIRAGERLKELIQDELHYYFAFSSAFLASTGFMSEKSAPELCGCLHLAVLVLAF